MIHARVDMTVSAQHMDGARPKVGTPLDLMIYVWGQYRLRRLASTSWCCCTHLQRPNPGNLFKPRS
ncbi:hypothetical protein BDV26DRAFT_267825 [Aspergillus bertholletiae]|uniref:Uncharacterized protein n=1 Tax=Aspergillus bertholletiae TaxID=1226010 RepID=A0A5N7B096_9EURO|nr:hypothetical protein BDV26DRAFT_267825 [Aspergillus bertholletiae]